MRVGDTVTDARRPTAEPCPGYREVKPMVYTGIFPIDTEDFENLRDALDKLSLNDPGHRVHARDERGAGVRLSRGLSGACLHLEVVKERLEREFGLDLIATAPSVQYHVYLTNHEMVEVDSPQEMPEPLAHRSHRGALPLP